MGTTHQDDIEICMQAKYPQTANNKIKEIKEGDFFKNMSVFSNLQRKRGEVTSCILQSMMLLSDFEYRSFAAGEVVRFAEILNENPDYELLGKTKDLFDRLFRVLPPYNKELDKDCLKKSISLFW